MIRLSCRLLTLVSSLLLLAPALEAQERAARPITSKPVEIAEPFSAVTRMLELADGRVLVYDATEKKLGVTGFDGSEFTEVARQGAGPLEYRTVISLLRLPGDSVMLWDMGNSRTMVLTPSAKPVRTTQLAESGTMMAMIGLPIARDIDAKGNWYATFQGMSIGDRRMDVADSSALVRVAAATGKRDTLMAFATPPRSNAPLAVIDGVVKVPALGFVHRNAWGAFPDGRVLVVHGETFVPEVIRPDGSRSKGAAVPFPRIAITAKDKADYMKQMQAQMGRGPAAMRGGQSPPRVEVQEPAEWLTHKPPVLNDVIRVDTKSRGWVRALDRDEEAGERYDLLDADGKLVDVVRMPKGVKLVGLGKGVVYGTREDEDGLVYLQRYPLP